MPKDRSCPIRQEAGPPHSIGPGPAVYDPCSSSPAASLRRLDLGGCHGGGGQRLRGCDEGSWCACYKGEGNEVVGAIKERGD